MDDFEVNGEQSDPAAEFLAREEKALFEIEDDNDSTNGNDNDAEDDINNDNNVDHQDDINVIEPFVNSETLNKFEENNNVNTSEREIPEKIQKWLEEQTEILRKKDLNEEEKKMELREQAKSELEDWYKQLDESIGKTKVINRNAEREFFAEKDAVARGSEAEGTEWDRVYNLCDFNAAKTNKNVKDISRMRSIILQLKQNPKVQKQ